MKPRVLQLTNTFHPAGSERQAVQITRLLHESSRYHVQMACLHPEGQMMEEVERLKLGELRSYPLTSFYNSGMARQLYRFATFLRKHKIDVVQTHDFYTNVFGILAAWLARVPARIAARRETAGMRTEAQLRVEHLVYKLSHAIVANAEAVREQLRREGVTNEQITTIYNGLHLERLTPKLRREEALKLFNLPADGDYRYVTILANLRHHVKDHPTFLRAAQIARKAVPEARFVIAGEGPLTDQMRSLARDLGLEQDVFFIGLCEQVSELLSVSDVCVLSSKAEGFSNSILEYMAAARPVVATDVGGAREVIVESETGYLAQAGDFQTMGTRIAELLSDPERAQQMGRRARQIVEQNFSCAAQLERTEQLYEKILARTSTRLSESGRKVRADDAEWLSK